MKRNVTLGSEVHDAMLSGGREGALSQISPHNVVLLPTRSQNGCYTKPVRCAPGRTRDLWSHATASRMQRLSSAMGKAACGRSRQLETRTSIHRKELVRSCWVPQTWHRCLAQQRKFHPERYMAGGASCVPTLHVGRLHHHKTVLYGSTTAVAIFGQIHNAKLTFNLLPAVDGQTFQEQTTRVVATPEFSSVSKPPKQWWLTGVMTATW